MFYRIIFLKYILEKSFWNDDELKGTFISLIWLDHTKKHPNPNLEREIFSSLIVKTKFLTTYNNLGEMVQKFSQDVVKTLNSWLNC